MSLESLIAHYGYAAIIAGTFLEGEATLIVGGIVSRMGYLNLPWVVLLALAGTLISDQTMFFIGRRYGTKLLKRFPRLQEKADKVGHTMRRHDTPLIMGFRFLYGLRSVVPFVLGMSRVPVWKFMALNLVGALLWVGGIGLAGYTFGYAAQASMDQIQHYAPVIAGTLLSGGLLFAGFRYLRRSRRVRSNA